MAALNEGPQISRLHTRLQPASWLMRLDPASSMFSCWHAQPKCASLLAAAG